MTRLAALQNAQPTPQALQLSRHARRVYVGSLPPGISEVALTHFFNQVRGVVVMSRLCMTLSCIVR
jgi:hypothetical protein